ncbi:unnamed protein product [Cylicostephanus goldi]|uniref:Uncharacterized protein n=1 Tax=Cylicostephanus goldi TaxID=71465 RepID=A0A3P7MQ50_CYLGO|nr:unnamed protein product [Cylicostephanus goldi]
MILCGKRSEEDDHHDDINHELFEQWLDHSIPHTLNRAGDRRVTLIMNNAPTIAGTSAKFPIRALPRARYLAVLEGKGVAVSERSSKDDLFYELRNFIKSKAALRDYAAYRKCNERLD